MVLNTPMLTDILQNSYFQKCCKIPIKIPVKKNFLNHVVELSDCNGIRTHNHLVRKRTLNMASLAKWLSVRLRTK